MTSPYTSRIVAMVLLLVGTFIAAIIPIFLIRKLRKKHQPIDGGSYTRHGSFIISFLICFGGGVLFATCFVHLMPEVREYFHVHEKKVVHKIDHDFNGTLNRLNFSKAKESVEHNHNHKHKHGLPMAELLISAGFFIVFFVEEAIHAALKHYHRKHPKATAEMSHGHSHSPAAMVCANRDVEVPQSLSKEPAPMDSPNSPSITKKRNNGTNPTDYGSTGTSTTVEPDTTDHAAEPSVAFSFKGLVIVVALSFHSIFEGLAIGLQATSKDVWTMFIAVSLHKFVIAFVVSLELYAKDISKVKVVIIYMTVFSCMSPVGILVGIFTEVALSSSNNIVVGYLTALATGTLLYVTFFEVLQMEKNSEVPGLVQFLAVAFGFGIMSFFTIYLPA